MKNCEHTKTRKIEGTKTVYIFAHQDWDFTYRDFPTLEVAEKHRVEIAEEFAVNPSDLRIESEEVSIEEYEELMEYAGF